MTIIIIFLLLLLFVAWILKKNGYVDPIQTQNAGKDNMMKFLATTYLTNKDFVEDKTVLMLLNRFNITQEEVIKYAEEHKDELMNKGNKDNKKENVEEKREEIEEEDKN